VSGKVEAIWIKRALRGPMDAVDAATLVEGEGIQDDVHQGRSHRQVSVIEQEIFARLQESLPEAEPHMRRANFMVSGISLEGARNRVLRLGAARILLEGETRPCERMDEACPGLREALASGWGGGAHGVVLDGGVVPVGAPAELETGTAERNGPAA